MIVYSGRLRSTTTVLAVAAAMFACRSDRSKPTAYAGTLVIGADYVQVLATAPGDRSCPPRIQRAGTCVRTPPAEAPGCADKPTCITAVTVSAPGQPTVASAGSFARVPWLATAPPAALTIAIRGCGGTLAIDVPATEPMAHFESVAAKLVEGQIELTWTPTRGADQVCGLWRWPGAVEVCCAAEGGAASFPVPSGLTEARLSRGVLITEVDGLRVYRTRETGNILAD